MKEGTFEQIKNKAKEVLERNTRFHCYAHAIEVMQNVEKLIDEEGKGKYDRDTLCVAALFHDASDSQSSGVEGKEGAEIAESVLREIKEFPSDKISDVKRLIESINEDRDKTDDEILLEAADQMAAFSFLGWCRSFMISGSRGMKVKVALEWELNFLEKRYSKFKLESAKVLVKKKYLRRIKDLENCLKLYEV